MSSNSVQAVDMLSDAVSGDFSTENVVLKELNSRVDVHVPEITTEPLSDDGSLIKNTRVSDNSRSPLIEPEGGRSGENLSRGFTDEGLMRERDSVGMEIEFVEASNSRANLGDFECLVDGREDGVEKTDLKVIMEESKCSIDEEEIDGHGREDCMPEKDSRANLVTVEGSVNANLNSRTRHLSPKSFNDESFVRDVKVTGDDNSGGFENRAEGIMSNEDMNGVQATEEELSDSKVVSLVVDLDECVKKTSKNSKKNDGFCAYDLVWGKVRSHPWWPGQIFDEEDASDKARKYIKSKSYLVAYFGDQSFAWNEKAKLKPFVPHFSHMVKQTSMEAFRHAVDCALDEVSRRVEFGLSCPCIADEVYGRLKSQVVENVGIREQSRIREGGDRFFTASSFEPVKFLDYVNFLAQGSHDEVDRLEHVVTRAQMSAFYRWKGCYHLAEFGPLIGYVNNEADNPSKERKKDISKVIDDSKTPKRKKISGEGCHPTKKLRPLSDLMSKKKGSYKGDGNDSSSIRKKKTAKVLHYDSETKDCSPKSQGITDMSSRDLKPSFSVGECILRVAGQLNQPSPLLKLDVSSHGKKTKAKSGSKKSKKRTEKVPSNCSSPVEFLSQLQLAAAEPLEEHSLLSSTITFFSDFRNSVVIDSEHEEITTMAEDLGCEQRNESENIVSESGEFDEKTEEEDLPTALDLKFTDIDSIPSKDKLNEIFSNFGPLKESETKVLSKKNWVRVVFKRGLDAQKAYSSSGKYEIFGPSLVSYRLDYAPSPRKSPSVGAKRRRKDGTSAKGNGA